MSLVFRLIIYSQYKNSWDAEGKGGETTSIQAFNITEAVLYSKASFCLLFRMVIHSLTLLHCTIGRPYYSSIHDSRATTVAIVNEARQSD